MDAVMSIQALIWFNISSKVFVSTNKTIGFRNYHYIASFRRHLSLFLSLKYFSGSCLTSHLTLRLYLVGNEVLHGIVHNSSATILHTDECSMKKRLNGLNSKYWDSFKLLFPCWMTFSGIPPEIEVPLKTGFCSGTDQGFNCCFSTTSKIQLGLSCILGFRMLLHVFNDVAAILHFVGSSGNQNLFRRCWS